MAHYLKARVGLTKSNTYVQVFTPKHFLRNSRCITTNNNTTIQILPNTPKKVRRRNTRLWSPKYSFPHWLCQNVHVLNLSFLKDLPTTRFHSPRRPCHAVSAIIHQSAVGVITAVNLRNHRGKYLEVFARVLDQQPRRRKPSSGIPKKGPSH